jgi:biopolymer transport protein ExbD
MRRNYAIRKLIRHHRKPAELTLVSMIDIFTVLVTFLLMTAVFSRTVIVELKLPTNNPEFVEPPPGLQMEVILRSNMVQVADRSSGPLATFPRSDAKQPYDLAGLSKYLQLVKAKYPELTDATLLLEKDIPYDSLVQVMDTLRILEQKQGNQLVQAELFPNVSIGDAPETDAPGAPGARP